jgi:hypothetical protein
MKRSIIIGLLILTSCTSKHPLENANQEKIPVVLEERNLTLTPATITDQNAAELFDLGTAPANGSNKTILNIINSTSSALNINTNALTTKFAQAGNRWKIGTTNTCTGILAAGANCRVQIVLNNNATTVLEDYTLPVEANLITGASPTKTIPSIFCPTGFTVAGATCIPSNPQFGKMIFTGQKAADVAINTIPMLGSIRFSALADNIIIKSGSVTKRYYMGNPLQTGNTIPVPAIIAPATGVISKNTCTSLTGLAPLKACFFEVTYNYDVAQQSLSESITFGTPNPLNGVSLDVTGVAINLAITNQPTVIPIQAASFVQVSKISDLSSTTQQERIYVTNTGSGVADLTAVNIPSPFVIAKTSCSTTQSVGSTCFFDLKIDTTKTSNALGLAPSISFGSSGSPVSAGLPLTQGQSGACKSGFSFINNSCQIVIPICTSQQFYNRTKNVCDMGLDLITLFNGKDFFVFSRFTGGPTRHSVIDSLGNIYSTNGAYGISKTDQFGNNSYFVGNGTGPSQSVPGISGYKNGTGNDVLFQNINNLTIDSNNNLYVIDIGNHLIRKITTAGVVTTFAGIPGEESITGINGLVTGTIGTAGIAGHIDGIAGVGTFTFDTTSLITTDKNGNIYVTDQNTIRKVTQNGTITTIAGLENSSSLVNGIGSSARFLNIRGLVVSPNTFDLYTLENDDVIQSTIMRKVTQSGNVSSFVGDINSSYLDEIDGNGINAKLGYQQTGLAILSNGNMLMTAGHGNIGDNQFKSGVRVISPDGNVSLIAGSMNGMTGMNMGNISVIDGIGQDITFGSQISEVLTDINDNIYVKEYGFSFAIRRGIL